MLYFRPLTVQAIPQLCITAVSVPGKEMSATGSIGERFIDNKRIEGSITQMLNDTLIFVRKNMKVKTIIDPETGKRNDRTEYPVIAVRELVINALIHRDYSITQSRRRLLLRCIPTEWKLKIRAACTAE